jgi:hypothetical protein
MRQHTEVYEVWQRNFYERIIREYISSNPVLWATDELHVKP